MKGTFKMRLNVIVGCMNSKTAMGQRKCIKKTITQSTETGEWECVAENKVWKQVMHKII